MATQKAREKTVIEQRADQEESDFFDVLSPEVTTVKLYRMEGGKQQVLQQYTPSQLGMNAEEVIAGEYGPGSYLLRTIRPNEPGKPGNRWGPSKVISIAEDSEYCKPYFRKHPLGEAAPHDYGTTTTTDPYFKLMEMQMKLAEDRANFLHERMDRQADNTQALILAMIQNNKNGGSDIASLIAGVRDLKQLSDGNGNGTAGRLSEIKELLALAAELGGGGGKEETPWGTLSRVLTMYLTEKREQLQAAPVTTNAGQQQPPAEAARAAALAPAPPPVPSPPNLLAPKPKPETEDALKAPGNGTASIPATAESGTVTAKPTVESANKGVDAAALGEKPAGAVTESLSSKLTLVQNLQRKADRDRDAALWADWTCEQAEDVRDPEAIQLLTTIAHQTLFVDWFRSLGVDPATGEWWEKFYQRSIDNLRDAGALGDTAAVAAGGAS